MRQPTKFAPFVTEPEEAGKLAPVLEGFEEGQLAQATNRSKETARLWKMGQRFPNGASLINLARNVPAVRAWLLCEIGGDGAEMDEARMLARLASMLQRELKGLDE